MRRVRSLIDSPNVFVPGSTPSRAPSVAAKSSSVIKAIVGTLNLKPVAAPQSS